MQYIETERHDGVGVVALNRPEARNALSMALTIELRRAIKEAAADKTLRALVITGRGGAFSAGADVKEWAGKKAGDDPYKDMDWMEEALKLVHDVFRMDKPTIAMIDGAAVGAGLDMALACDFRVASDKAKFICSYTNIGYPPDCGGSWLMPRVMGIENAKLFAYSGDLWTSDEAKAHGLVTKVVPQASLESETIAFAQKLASGPTVAIGLAKRLIDSSDRRSLAEQQIEEKSAGKLCANTKDHAEGLAAANERRAPMFIGA